MSDPAAIVEEVQRILGPSAVPATAGTVPAWRVPAAEIHDAAAYLHDAGFDYLLFLTAVDYPAEKRLEVTYMVTRFAGEAAVAILADIDRDSPEIDSVSNIWMAADWHEREAYDMFGIRFRNHPFLRRLFLDEDWPGYPLRKDYVDTLHDVAKRPY